jgi:hypothetical protein
MALHFCGLHMELLFHKNLLMMMAYPLAMYAQFEYVHVLMVLKIMNEVETI